VYELGSVAERLQNGRSLNLYFSFLQQAVDTWGEHPKRHRTRPDLPYLGPHRTPFRTQSASAKASCPLTTDKVRYLDAVDNRLTYCISNSQPRVLLDACAEIGKNVVLFVSVFPGHHGMSSGDEGSLNSPISGRTSSSSVSGNHSAEHEFQRRQQSVGTGLCSRCSGKVKTQSAELRYLKCWKDVMSFPDQLALYAKYMPLFCQIRLLLECFTPLVSWRVMSKERWRWRHAIIVRKCW